jgi:hypothetical protein
MWHCRGRTEMLTDGLVVGNTDEEIELFLGLLQEEFKIKICSLENFLGMQIVSK